MKRIFDRAGRALLCALLLLALLAPESAPLVREARP